MYFLDSLLFLKVREHTFGLNVVEPIDLNVIESIDLNVVENHF